MPDLLYSPPISRPIRELLLSSYPIRNEGEYWLRSKVPRNLNVSMLPQKEKLQQNMLLNLDSNNRVKCLGISYHEKANDKRIMLSTANVQ